MPAQPSSTTPKMLNMTQRQERSNARYAFPWCRSEGNARLSWDDYHVQRNCRSKNVGVGTSLAGRTARCIGQSRRGRPACWPNMLEPGLHRQIPIAYLQASCFSSCSPCSSGNYLPHAQASYFLCRHCLRFWRSYFTTSFVGSPPEARLDHLRRVPQCKRRTPRKHWPPRRKVLECALSSPVTETEAVPRFSSAHGGYPLCRAL
jgi:hypothetical protein